MVKAIKDTNPFNKDSANIYFANAVNNILMNIAKNHFRVSGYTLILIHFQILGASLNPIGLKLTTIHLSYSILVCYFELASVVWPTFLKFL
ncbi:MAG: hypothetical protein DYH15_11475 [Nitrosomonas sp. PRO4]|nr:hypothetical protein [Nitrosomonas sp. PRO4]